MHNWIISSISSAKVIKDFFNGRKAKFVRLPSLTAHEATRTRTGACPTRGNEAYRGGRKR